MSIGYQARIPRLYRYVAPVYRTLRPFWARTTNRAAEHYLESAMLPTAIHPAADVLDLGCGPGTNLERFRRLNLPCARYVGLDLSPLMLAKRPASMVASANFVLGDAHRLPFADGSFDVILSTWMFSHLPVPFSVVLEARRLLRPGGWLIVACFARPRGLLTVLLRIIEPLFLMRCAPSQEIQTWPGLVEVRSFAWGFHLVVRVRQNGWKDRLQ
ncbi:MAG: class I SAM-dependent methyltransferase [Candidatus Promineifilaceae bacterium]